MTHFLVSLHHLLADGCTFYLITGRDICSIKITNHHGLYLVFIQVDRHQEQERFWVPLAVASMNITGVWHTTSVVWWVDIRVSEDLLPPTQGN